MNQDLKDYTWVFVGCGGTFYAASPYLAVLVKQYCSRPVILIDPDTAEEGNASRQWPHLSQGESKVMAGSIALSPRHQVEIEGRFSASDSLLEELTDGRPVLAIVNVDNDEARLDVANWLGSRVSPGIMVVSGCERTHGQCYSGVWDEGEAILDWRTFHPDVGGGGAAPVNPCNLQDVRSNALTGVLVGLCIEDVDRWLEDTSLEALSEFYWDLDPETLRIKMWELRVDAKRMVTA